MECYVIIADPETSSCLVNAVYTDKEECEIVVAKMNEKKTCYYIEESQLITDLVEA